ncbi:MAG: hypothetical protein HYY40_05370 [Bacteroidetes bacterium]|nr:hypothetical protein [Bacteroidota bacterium]
MNKVLSSAAILAINFFFPFLSSGQDSVPPTPVIPRSYKVTPVPSIGFGTGYFSYLGDIKNEVKTLPFINHFAYRFTLSYNPVSYLHVYLNGMRGKVRADETTRHLNFESRIVFGGLSAVYNFDHFLKPERKLSPLFSIGVEFTDFRAKGDLSTEINDTAYSYYYWNDGSIHSVPQGLSTNGKILSRDNTYETDLRDADIDGLGKYPQTAMALPIGIGLRYKINERMRLELMPVFHLTFTDLADNVSGKGSGTRKGNSGNDNFLFTGISFHYDLIKAPPPVPPVDSALLALLEDEDKDGVVNSKDLCPGTPVGVSVDTTGCPIDTDKDGYPDYIDHEIHSPPGATVDEFGVAIKDTINYLTYYDTVKKAVPEDTTPVFRVQLAAFPPGTNPSADIVDKLLSYEGVVSDNASDGTTVYMVGNFPNPEEAEVERIHLLEKGILPDLKLIQWVPVYKTDIVPDSAKVAQLLNKQPEISPVEEDVLFRVQLGAFRFKPRFNIFGKVGDLVTFKGDDGLTRYYTGEFKNYDKAVIHRDEMLGEGFKGAFIVVYKAGKRIPVGSYGSTGTSNIIVTEESTVKNQVKSNGLEEVKHNIRFKVQLGAFKQGVPPQVQEKCNKLGNINTFVNAEGFTVVTTGSFTNYRSAVDLKEEIIKDPLLKNAFVAAYDGDKPILLKEAFKIIRESK